MAYARGETDEFVSATVIAGDDPPITVRDGDTLIFTNYRADRARQLARAFGARDFADFPRCTSPSNTRLIRMHAYHTGDDFLVAYSPETIKNTLGACLEKQNLKQLRIAETEKYAHVTFFFNGGQDKGS